MNLTPEQLRVSMKEFDEKFRDKREWSDWTQNKNYKFAIFDNDRLYPVKQIISMALGKPKSDFSGGIQSNTVITRCGFSVISLRESSWTITSSTEAVKKLDKSAFTQGTGIPIEIRPFFMRADPRVGERLPIKLVHQGQVFQAYIAIESSPTHRTRLFWHQDFIKELANRFPLQFSYVTNGKDIKDLPHIELIFKRQEQFHLYKVELREGITSSAEWSDGEIEAAVKAYLWMRDQELNEKPYSKTQVNKALREGDLSGRSKASIEYRMQNISAVLEEICQPRIKGYLPAKNIGSQTKDKVLSILEKLGACCREDYEPAFDQQVVDARARKILKRHIEGVPKGQASPKQSTRSSASYARDPLVKAWVLQNAKGRCEGCETPAPFINKVGEPYLEVHHACTLAEGGADTIYNTVALCPNCHRKCHEGLDSDDFVKTLYKRISRLQKESQVPPERLPLGN